MGKALPQHSTSERRTEPSFWRNDESPDIKALREENARLRELVAQLSELVIKNIVDTIEDA
jgi:hypothetical protein